MDAEEKRIAKIFEKKDVPNVTEKNLQIYRKYLLQQFDKNAILTGREDFPWEEKFVFGFGSRSEYDKLKKNQPSYTDDYDLLDILEDDFTDEHDLPAKVKRISDGKIFEIRLSWLTTKNDKSKEYQLLDDFATWVVNW
jgi:hypothetical protein